MIRKFLWFALFAAIFAWFGKDGTSQTNASIVYVTSTPTGTCQARTNLRLKTPNGDLYSCQAGTWGKVGGSSGSVTSIATGCGISGGTITTTGTLVGTGVCTTIANASSVGTTTNKLAKVTGAPSKAVISGAGDSSGAIGVVDSGAGTTGNVVIQGSGQHGCVFDGATTAGHYVQISSSVAGDCTDAGAAFPSSGQVIGIVLSTNVSGGTYTIDMALQQVAGMSTTISGPYILSGGSYYSGPHNTLMTLPVLANLSWLTTQGTATVTNNGGALTLEDTPAASDHVRLFGLAIGSNTTLTTYAACTSFVANFNTCGIAFQESSTGKLILLSYSNSSNLQQIHVETWNSPTSIAAVVQSSAVGYGNLQWLALRLIYTTGSPGTITFQTSFDDVNFQTIYTSNANLFFTTAPDRWGYYVDNNSGTTTNIFNTLYSLAVQ